MKNTTQTFLQNLGLCRKAGALVFGFDAVTEAMKKGKAAGVLTTSDISPKTLKEIRFHAEKYNTSVFEIPASMEETGVLLGKKAGVLAVTDEKLLNILNLGGK